METPTEFGEYYHEQIFSSPIPSYKPPAYSDFADRDFHICVDCGDRYILESSLNTHLSRKSVAITYFCRPCNQSLNFQNRCNLLAHLRQHPEINEDSLSILISPLPVSNDDGGNSESISPKVNRDVGSCKDTKQSKTKGNIMEKASDNLVGASKKEHSLQITSVKPGEVKVLISETQKSDLVNKSVKCRECGVSVENIRLHFLGDNKPFNPQIRCQCCDHILPTKCNLKAHLRIHFKKFPFICPDCMKEFAFFELFMVHLRYFCFHLDKCSRFQCQACPGIFPSLTSLEVHLATRHVKPVYKCVACPRAFFEQKLLNDHKVQSHGDIKIPTKFFEQCQLCPQKLLTKNNLFIHIHGHVMSKNVCFYSYKCSNCKYVTDTKLKFASHRLTCPASEKDASAHALAKLAKTNLAGDAEKDALINTKRPIAVCLPNFSNSSATSPGSLYLQGTDKNVLSKSGLKVNIGPNGKKILNRVPNASKQLVILPKENRNIKGSLSQRVYKDCGWFPNKCLMCQNELTLGIQFARYNCPASYEGCLKWKFNNTKLEGNSHCSKQQVFHDKPRISKSNKKNCMAFNGPSNALKVSVPSSDSNTYLCHICKHSIQINHVTIQKHFRQQHPDVELMSLFPLMYKFELPKVNIPLECLNLSLKKSKVFQTVTIQVRMPASSKKINPAGRKKFLKMKQSTLQNCKRNVNTVKHWLVCSKCAFKTKNRKTYRKHVNSHKSSSSSSYQCPECGLRFVVEPSLKKHLILHHGQGELNMQLKNDDLSHGGELALDTDSSEDKLKCKVCHKSFENTGDLQKHFRIHGMAFLMLNKDETVWRKV